LIAYTFFILFFAIKIPSSEISSVNSNQFKAVFGQSQLIIVGSIVAFLASQHRCYYFPFCKKKNRNKMIWLRSTGSTVISQLFDSFIVLGIAFGYQELWILKLILFRVLQVIQ
jgi:uncharacterized integral membrane protein (TIGR00697 family)